MPEGVKREGEAQEGPQLLTGIAKLGKLFCCWGSRQRRQPTSRRGGRCVFSTIKLNCDVVES